MKREFQVPPEPPCAAPSHPLAAPEALDFPRADGPTRADQPLPLHDAAAHARRPRHSVATLLFGVLFLVTGWAIGISYLFNYLGVSQAFEAEERETTARAARVVEDTLALEAANLEAVVAALREDVEFIRAAGDADPGRVLAPLADRVRQLTGVDMIEVADRGGRLVHRSGERMDPAAAEAPIMAADGKPRLTVRSEGGALVLRASGPLPDGSRAVAMVAVERVVHRGYLRETTGGMGAHVTLTNGERVIASTRMTAAQGLDLSAIAPVLQGGRPQFLDGPQRGTMVRPTVLGTSRLAIVVHAAENKGNAVMAAARERLLAVVGVTLLFAVLLGLVLTRTLIRPINRLTERAEELSLRFAGRSVPRSGSEFDTLVASFDAMTEALLAHSERLKRTHLNELQNSLELQRQYALMRLLRGLAAAANEADTAEETLERALNEVGEYLDWPVGRVALLPDDRSEHDPLPRSLWFVRDPARFEPFIAASEGLTIVKSVHGLIGRAYISGMPHWVSDLSRINEWRRSDVAARCGLQSGVVIPVTARGHVTAFIEFFTDHRVEATAEMLELIEAIGAELSRVAERQQAERELRLREAEARRLALVASHTEKAVVIVDTSGRVEWVNDAFSRWTGHSLEEARGRVTPKAAVACTRSRASRCWTRAGVTCSTRWWPPTSRA
jgi:PAS domain-containing protein